MADRPAPSSWLADVPDRLRPALEGCATGALPPNIALLRLAIEALGPEEVEEALSRAGRSPQGGSGGAAERLDAALALWRANPQAFALVKSVLDGHEHGGLAASPRQGVARWAEAFDRLARAAPEGGVALYALGNPDLLRSATQEVVAWLAGQGLIGPTRRVLEIGCGIGRFVAALSPLVDRVTGLDVSAGMVARARERCAGLPNVTLEVSSGADLSGVPDGAVDLVLGADVFPYLVQAGDEIVTGHVREAARVLGPGGHLVILNFSYRGNPERDREEVAALASREGFAILRSGSRDFSLWDAASFVLRKG